MSNDIITIAERTETHITYRTLSSDHEMDIVENPPASPVKLQGLKGHDLQENEVEYKIQYRNLTTDAIVYEEKTDSLVVEWAAGSKTQRIFDIVTVFHTLEKPDGVKRAPTPVKSTGDVSIHIKSPAIINALRSVVNYYPSQDLFGDKIIIPAPYAVLVHHRKELLEFGEKMNPANHDDKMCVREQDAYRHLGILMEFLEDNIMSQVRAEEERNARGCETFKMAWLRRKPGKTYRFWLRGDRDNKIAAVIHSLSGGSFQNPETPWIIRYWTMDYNGICIGKCHDLSTVEKWDGERDCDHEPVFEESDFENLEQELTKDLILRGERFYSLLSKKCQYYKGTTTEFPFHSVDGLVMLDAKTFLTSPACPPNEKPILESLQREKTWVSDCICQICRKRIEANTVSTRKALFQGYNGIYPEDEREDESLGITLHQKLLLPAKIWGFVFKTRTWEKLHVANFQDPTFQPGMIDQLVMKSERRKTLKALSSNYIRKNQAGEVSKLPMWTADFIAGKGQGIIFLLHGRPGVGKTYTAECIAEYAQRPLMILTSSDIGTNPEKLEEVLTTQFKRASSWGAVLLIDEADVFMERRSTNDLNRNSLVAAFLRALEFYDGILFLTTNRVGFFDDAFISRIHVQLYYPDFTDEDRKQVWKSFMDKLKLERGKTIRISIEAKEYIGGKEIKLVKWNGREIRNAFQTAVALAEYEAEKDEEGRILLKDDHLKSIVEMSRDFKDYLERLHHGNEEKRAEREFSRLAEDGEQHSKDED